MNSRRRQTEERQGAGGRLVLGALTVTVFAAAAAAAGIWYGQTVAARRAEPAVTAAHLESLFHREHRILQEARSRAQARLDALAGRIGEAQAQIQRLNAVGERLVEMTELDAEEFDFDNPPPVGGPEDAEATAETTLASLSEDVEGLPGLIRDRRRKLELLEQAILEIDLKKHSTPSDWPVLSGYITSKFGYRKHPIRKKTHFHSGVDFACKRGSPVLAAADGVVTFSGWQSGYGRLVEIRHPDGLVTRYAHNQKNLVKQGEKVEKGQTIAKVGSSGRSTGPHVHFEVRKNGKALDPLQYVGTKPSRTDG